MINLDNTQVVDGGRIYPGGYVRVKNKPFKNGQFTHQCQLSVWHYILQFYAPKQGYTADINQRGLLRVYFNGKIWRKFPSDECLTVSVQNGIVAKNQYIIRLSNADYEPDYQYDSDLIANWEASIGRSLDAAESGRQPCFVDDQAYSKVIKGCVTHQPVVIVTPHFVHPVSEHHMVYDQCGKRLPTKTSFPLHTKKWIQPTQAALS